MATPAERISHAEELDLPAELGVMREVFSELTPEAARSFAAAVLEALEQVRETADLRPLRDVVETWYRTLLFVRRGGLGEALDEADGILGTEGGVGLAALLEKYSLPEPDADGIRGVRILPMVRP